MPTKNCVRCFKPAKFWTGHVLKDGKKVTAGWCSERCFNVPGFRGQWDEVMVASHAIFPKIGRIAHASK